MSVDADNTGFIERREAHAVLARLGIDAADDEDEDEVYADADEDRDGRLSLAEFVAYMSDMTVFLDDDAFLAVCSARPPAGAPSGEF